jgi:hypothetical protein
VATNGSKIISVGHIGHRATLSITRLMRLIAPFQRLFEPEATLLPPHRRP